MFLREGEFVLKKYRVVVNETEYVVSVEAMEEGTASVPATSTQGKQPEAPATSGNVAPPQTAPEAKPIPDTSNFPVEAPLRGTILNILVKEGSEVKEGDVLLTLEALKLENEITSPAAGVVAQVLVKQGDSVEPGEILATLRNNA